MKTLKNKHPAPQATSPAGELPLKRMFDAVPKQYDLLNRLLTLRLDECWRKQAAKLCLKDRPRRVLDLCCGTGDLTRQLLKGSGGKVEIFGLDFSAAMLQIARQKTATQPVTFIEGNASAMKFPDQHFDAVGIAFAFRNLSWKNRLREAALAEVRRVLSGRGKFVIVETSQPPNRILRAAFHFHLRMLVAPFGGWVSGHKGAYRYLAESATNFFPADQVSQMLEAAGFVKISASRLLGGLAAIHIAHKA